MIVNALIVSHICVPPFLTAFGLCGGICPHFQMLSIIQRFEIYIINMSI